MQLTLVVLELQGRYPGHRLQIALLHTRSQPDQAQQKHQRVMQIPVVPVLALPTARRQFQQARLNIKQLQQQSMAG